MLKAFAVVGLPVLSWLGMAVMADMFQLSRLARRSLPTEEPVPMLSWLILLLSALAWTAVFLRCRRLFARGGRSMARSLAAHGALGFLVVVSFILSFLSFAAWAPYVRQSELMLFLILHATGMAILAYGWARPRLESRFRDLATRPFES